MKIYAKAALDRTQIDVKTKIGCDGIEIQLLDEIVDDYRGIYKNIYSVFDLKQFENDNIRAVHVPICKHGVDMTLEQLSDTQDFMLLYNTCELANYYGEHQGKRVTVIVHSDISLEFIEGLGDTLHRIEHCINKLLTTFPTIRIGIENSPPFLNVREKTVSHFCNNFGTENVALVQRIKHDISTERVGTVLDTAHAMLAEKYINAIFKEMGDIDPPDMSLDRFFRENAQDCFLVHLADILDSGFGPGKHGIPFKETTRDRCYNVLKLYAKYGYKCPVTLEVEETDYNVSDGYESTKKVVDSIIVNK